MYKLMNFVGKIVKIIQWLPIIWKDEDWDYAYLLILLQYKLKRMKACLGYDKYIKHRELRDTIIDINKCISAIDEYINSDDIFEEYYEKCPVEIGHESKDSKYISINIKTGKELTEEENHAFVQHIIKRNEFEQEKWNAIWDRLKDYAQKFWD